MPGRPPVASSAAPRRRRRLGPPAAGDTPGCRPRWSLARNASAARACRRWRSAVGSSAYSTSWVRTCANRSLGAASALNDVGRDGWVELVEQLVGWLVDERAQDADGELATQHGRVLQQPPGRREVSGPAGGRSRPARLAAALRHVARRLHQAHQLQDEERVALRSGLHHPHERVIRSTAPSPRGLTAQPRAASGQ